MTAGDIIALCAMVVSIVFGIISILRSEKAKKSEEKAGVFAKNADSHNMAAKKYYDKMVGLLSEYIRMNLIYENHAINIKKEAIQITNLSSSTITLVEFGVYLNEHKVDIAKLDIEIEELPLSIVSNSQEKINHVKAIIKSYIEKKDIHYFLGFALLGKENPYRNDKDNPKVYFYAKDTRGAEYKTFIGMRKDIIERYKNY